MEVCKMEDIGEFKKRIRQHRGQRLLKDELMFYLRISQYSKDNWCVFHCQNYLEIKYGTQR